MVAEAEMITELGVKRVAIEDLAAGDSPRLGGIDDAHVARLIECDAELPPIVVHRQTMRVIDGMHRLTAAMRKGHGAVDVTYFDGDDYEAFLLAVELNVKHGLPLSLQDRKAAVRRILAASTNLSDRAIAMKAGLSDKTVAKIRASSRADFPKVDTRRGRDGHLYWVDGSDRRQQVVQLIAKHPGASLREIATAAGVSPTTVSNIRKRLSTGGNRGSAKPRPVSASHVSGKGSPAADMDIKEALGRLCADPSVRAKESGRAVLRWLSGHAIGVGDLPDLAGIPPHRGELVAKVARQSADAWLELARRLEAAVTRSETQ